MCPAWGGDAWAFLFLFKPQRASLRAQRFLSLWRIVAVAGLTLDAWPSVASWMVHVWHGLERRVRNMSCPRILVLRVLNEGPQVPSVGNDRSPCWIVYHEVLVFFFVDQSSRAGLAGFRDMSLGPGSKKKFSAAKPPCIPISVFVVDYLQRV